MTITSKLYIPLSFGLTLLGCEATKVDDQAAKELDQASAKAKASIDAKAERVGDQAEDLGAKAETELRDAIERAEQRLVALDEQLAQAKADGRELNDEAQAKLAAAKAELAAKARAAKQSSAEQASAAIAELNASLNEIDAALQSATKP